MNISSFQEPFEFEKIADKEMLRTIIKERWHYTFLCAVFYVVAIFTLQKYMKQRPALKVRSFFSVWNAILAILSISATVRMLPAFTHLVKEYGFHYSVCDNGILEDYQEFIFWGWLFICCKVVELGDTIFIVLKKQKLIFLHWYHHIVALLITWYGISKEASLGAWLMINNTIIHSLMYTYFTLKTLNVKIPRYISKFITILQIVQMIFGVFISIWAYSATRSQEPCKTPYDYIMISFSVYFVYVFQFSHLYYKSYVISSDKHALGKKSN